MKTDWSRDWSILRHAFFQLSKLAHDSESKRLIFTKAVDHLLSPFQLASYQTSILAMDDAFGESPLLSLKSDSNLVAE
jgi:hypothetical protein